MQLKPSVKTSPNRPSSALNPWNLLQRNSRVSPWIWDYLCWMRQETSSLNCTNLLCSTNRSVIPSLEASITPNWNTSEPIIVSPKEAISWNSSQARKVVQGRRVTTRVVVNESSRRWKSKLPIYQRFCKPTIIFRWALPKGATLWTAFKLSS